MKRAPSFIAAFALSAVPLLAQFAGTTPKDKPADYPAHTTSSGITLAGEYLVHSIPTGHEMLVAYDYLVIELAVFPTPGAPVTIGSNTFGLRLNGKKQLLYPDSPGSVAASMKYPDWNQHPTTEVYAGAGDTGVVIGRPPVVGRFPGDPTPDQTRLPRAPQAPPPDDRRGIDSSEPVNPDVAVADLALPEGTATKPVAGYLYFRYKGKTKSIKSLDLVYENPAGTVTLKLI